MSLCDVCADPGRCCRSIKLTAPDAAGEHHPVTFWLDEDWQIAATDRMDRAGLPFIPEAVHQRWTSPEGREYGSLIFRCPHVTEAGRCGIYDERPQTCRNYEAGSDYLCAMRAPSNEAFA